MLPSLFTLGNHSYAYKSTGICNQITPHKISYDDEYVILRYNSYGELGARMAMLRCGYVIGSLGRIPSSILDVGYGNGEFLRQISNITSEAYGFDAPPAYPISPIPCVDSIFDREYDIVTFFDSLEHFDDPAIISSLKTDNVLISIPWFHPELGISWFESWRHRRPNEHLWHFSLEGITSFFAELGFSVKAYGNPEDLIRKNHEQDAPNILTALFTRN